MPPSANNEAVQALDALGKVARAPHFRNRAPGAPATIRCSATQPGPHLTLAWAMN